MIFFKYSDPDLCVVNTLTYRLTSTSSLVPATGSSLFITHRKHQKNPSKNTVRRRILNILSRARINSSRYKVHSPRHTLLPKSFPQGLGGRKSENVFRKRYRLPIMTPDTLPWLQHHMRGIT